MDMETGSQPRITMRVQYRTSADSPLVDLGEVEITESGANMLRCSNQEVITQ